MLKKDVWFTKAEDVRVILKIMTEYAKQHNGKVEVLEAFQLSDDDGDYAPNCPLWIEEAVEYLIKKHGQKKGVMRFKSFLYDLRPPGLEQGTRIKAWRPDRVQ